MYTFTFDHDATKAQFYSELKGQIESIIAGQRNWVTNLANAASLIYHGMNSVSLFGDSSVNWAGFYLADKLKLELLYLGPFQGKVACMEIKYGRGVCGAAAQSGITQVVPNVHLFPGHIACDSGSNSEIVVPLLRTSVPHVLGVLDIDSLVTGTFDEEDRAGLEPICELLAAGCDWD